MTFPACRSVLFLAGSVALAATSTGAPSARQDVRTENGDNVVLEGVPDIPDRIRRWVRQYQSTRSARFADWAPAGEGMFILTAFAERSQVHRVERPEGARRQLTFVEGTLDGEVRRRPGGRELLLRLEEGGREQYRLSLVDPATGSWSRLTDGTSWCSKAQWSPDGTCVACTATGRDGSSKDIVVIPVDEPSRARVVHEAPDEHWWGVIEWHPGGDRIALVHDAGQAEAVLLHLESGRREPLDGTFAGPPASFARFTHDGTGAYALVRSPASAATLVRVDFDGGETRRLATLPPNVVGGLEVSPNGRWLAFTTNEDGASGLFVLDLEREGLRRVDSLPKNALIGDLRFDPTGSHLGFSVNSAITPSDAFSIELDPDGGEDRLTRWTFSEVGGLDTEGFAVPELVHYPTFDEVDGERRRIPAFLYRPPGAGPHPVVVWIHGGPFYQFRPLFNGEIQMWVNQLGVAVVAPNVRGSSGYGKAYMDLDDGPLREDSVRDISALLDWIREREDLDHERVITYGGSYGGYMVLASLIHDSHRLRGGVAFSGISRFVSLLENATERHRTSQRLEYGDERDPEVRAHLERISPLHNVDRIQAPLFIAHGDNDPRCPVGESTQVVEALRERGRPVWFMRALNDGHFFTEKGNRELLQAITVLFLEENLRDQPGSR